MTSTITKLPTAPTSFYTVRKFRLAYAVEMVTPAGGNLLRTKISVHVTRAEAIEAGRRIAGHMNRPFRAGGAK